MFKVTPISDSVPCRGLRSRMPDQQRSPRHPDAAPPLVSTERGPPSRQDALGNSGVAERLGGAIGQSASGMGGVGAGAATEARVAGVSAETRTPTAAAQSATPRKIANPAPVQAGERRRTVLGVQIIGNDVSPSALDACATFVELTLSHREDIQERLRGARVALIIIPRNKAMTDVPQFASLRGTHTFDGRLWDDVRGSGGQRAGGLWAVGVPEENLVQTVAGDGREDGHGEGFGIGLHELAHTIHNRGVSSSERRDIARLYAVRQRAGGPWTEGYGASNADEYFAQATNCFFQQNGGVGQNSPAWLEQNDPDLYALLVRIYGAPARAQA